MLARYSTASKAPSINASERVTRSPNLPFVYHLAPNVSSNFSPVHNMEPNLIRQIQFVHNIYGDFKF